MRTALSPRHLAASLEAAPRYRVAFSGGMDSTVLLHALATARADLSGSLCAVHVNHGLCPEAGAWARHCEGFCRELGVPLEVIQVDARPGPGESPEAAAREARYRALAELLDSGEVLVAAHHQDDQTETVLLHLLRGAGVAGLAGIPPRRALGRGRLVRPLLGLPRAALLRYAQDHGLAWVEDPANRQERLDRNYLRHGVIPLLRERWPALGQCLARAAAHQAEAAELLGDQARQDLAGVRGPTPDTLQVTGLRRLSGLRQANVLRHWVAVLGLAPPRAVHLERVLQDVVAARPDAEPRVVWAHTEVRRYRDLLFARPLPRNPVRPPGPVPWQPPGAVAVADGVLRGTPATGAGLSAERCSGRPVTVRYRQGGERCRPVGRPHAQALKKLLQERGVPPWVRSVLPLVYVGEDLAAVGDLWVCEPYGAGSGEPGWVLHWAPARGVGP